MHNSPCLSIVVPCYERLHLLQQTVHSLRQQTASDFEVLLIDDRSSVDVQGFLSRTLADNRFRFVTKPVEIPRGCQHSRNLGLELAKGRYVMFLDSDDLLAEWCVEARTNFAASSGAADIIVGNQAIFYESTGHGVWVNKYRRDVTPLMRFLSLKPVLDVPWVNGGCLILREFLLRTGVRWRPDYLWDDVAFHTECLMQDCTVSWMPRSLSPDSWYRVHGTEHFGSQLHSSQGRLNTLRMLENFRRLLKVRGEVDAVFSSALACAVFHQCILPEVDDGSFHAAFKFLSEAVSSGLVDRASSLSLRVFALLRKSCENIPRARFFVNRFARRLLLEFFFEPNVGYYALEPADVSELACMLVRSASGGSS